MTHLDTEITQLKTDLREMMGLTVGQLEKARDAMLRNDKELAREVMFYERRVNSLELKIDRDCENILALLAPVAIDLRLVLATLKINSSLERIADNAESMARYVSTAAEPFDAELLESIQMRPMFDTAVSMLSDIRDALDAEDSRIARGVLSKDDLLDSINLAAPHTIEAFIRKNIDKTYQSLFVLSAVRKLERVGDVCQNMAEEIIFYLEAKVVKHNLPKS
ncbi:MAG TPA: phosphate signaling complex protein PhoU [Chitinophagales bacterium]|nr:phosphate signaling complex protein PhoU [Chitinophagales bacterium]